MKKVHTVLIPEIYDDDFQDLRLDGRLEPIYWYLAKTGTMRAYIVEVNDDDLLIIKLSIPQASVVDTITTEDEASAYSTTGTQMRFTSRVRKFPQP